MCCSIHACKLAEVVESTQPGDWAFEFAKGADAAGWAMAHRRRVATLVDVYYTYTMPRASSPHRSVTRPAREIAADLARWMRRQELTQAQVADLLSVRQPQISRILRARFSPRSHAVRSWCEMAGVALTTHASAAEGANRQTLVNLLDHVWDGTEEDVTRVAALLQAAAELRRPL